MQKHAILRALHLATGISGLIFFAGFDTLRGQAVDIGLQQFAGLAISIIIILSGIYDRLPWQKKFSLASLFLLYLGGILFMGLRPGPSHGHHHLALLSTAAFARGDFIINTLGFIPLGFLTMALLAEMGPLARRHRLVWTLTFCLTISLAIEILQYFFLPGRTSSLYDVIANTMGALLGGILEDCENRQAMPSP